MANKEMVKKFLLQNEYLWDGKVMNRDYEFIEATDSPNGKLIGDFIGEMLIVNLITLEGKNRYGMEVSPTDFKIYTIEDNGDPHRPEDEYFLKNDFKFSWMKFILEYYGTNGNCNQIQDYCYDEMSRIREQYLKKISSLKEKIETLELEMKNKCEPYGELYLLASKKTGRKR